MHDSSVNVLLTTFAGLRLPRTLAFASSSNATVQDVLGEIHERLPLGDHSYIITTTSNRQLSSDDHAEVSSLLSNSEDDFLPLRLSTRIRGGKGGFGSQLRAAGGRMSSRKKRDQHNQPQNGSNRTLDGRRLQTVRTAKALAEYYANKPAAEEKAKKDRREKLEKTVGIADKREEEIKSGKAGSNQGRLDAEYVESKELAEERTRQAVIKAMREGGLARTGSESSVEAKASDSGEEVAEASESSGNDDEMVTQADRSMSLFGWDEDEDEDSENEEDEAPTEQGAPAAYEGKGKGKLV